MAYAWISTGLTESIFYTAGALPAISPIKTTTAVARAFCITECIEYPGCNSFAYLTATNTNNCLLSAIVEGESTRLQRLPFINVSTFKASLDQNFFLSFFWILIIWFRLLRDVSEGTSEKCSRDESYSRDTHQRVDTIKREMFSQKSVRRFVGDSSAFVMGAMFLASALKRSISPRY